MKPLDYKELVELIDLFGSAQFWRGANNGNESYDRLTEDSVKYRKQILIFLSERL